MDDKIKRAVKDAGVYLERLTASGIAGVANCQYVALIAANLELISEEIAKSEKKSVEGVENDENCDDIRRQ